MQVTKRIHHAYLELQKSKLPQSFGKYQYIYSSDKGEISLVRLFDYVGIKKSYWEIYSLEGDLFDDVERFDTKKEAEKRIKQLLK